MTFAAALRSHLMLDPVLSGYVQGRVFPGAIPPPGPGQSWPGDSLSYSLISAASSDGIGPSREARREWEVVAVSEDYERAHEIADAVEAALDFFSGRMGGEDGVRVMACRRESMTDAQDFDFGLFAVVQTYDVRYLKPAV